MRPGALARADPCFPAQPGDFDTRLAAVTSRWAKRFGAFGAALNGRHPAIAHHLAIVAAQPDGQGQGTGTALLHACHKNLDHDAGAPAYLGASELRTCQNYLRHGYADLWLPVGLPGGHLLYPTRRQPRAALAGQTTPFGPG